MQIARQYSRPGIFRYLRDCVCADDWQRQLEELKKTDESICKHLSTQDSNALKVIDKRIAELTSKFEKSLALLEDINSHVEARSPLQHFCPFAYTSIRDLQLGKLPRAAHAVFNAFNMDASSSSECLEGTRVDILSQIEKWAYNSNDDIIFWVNGTAGTGKSTIARTVASRFNHQCCLGANFFFSKGKEGLENAEKLFSTFALQLTEVLPQLKKHVYNAIQKQGDVGGLNLISQWKSLVLEPLQKLDRDLLVSPLLVFVIDALDECGGDNVARIILELFMGVKDLNMIRVRIFITSRPEGAIRRGFNQIPKTAYHEFKLHTVEKSVIEHDISKFIRHELLKVKDENQTILANDWPCEKDKNELVRKSGSLFIYAATVCRYITDSNFPQKHLSRVLQITPDARQSPVKALDDMYTRILDDGIVKNGDAEDMIPLFRHIVGSIVVLFNPVSIKVLTSLLQLATSDMRGTLEALPSVLDIPQDETAPIQLFHLSFRDFLLDENIDGTTRSTDHFHIQEKSAHYKIFLHCLDLMTCHDHLRDNMCDLKFPGALAAEVSPGKIEEFIPLHIQYACRYWPDHLKHSGYNLRSVEDVEKTRKFFNVHFLHWLEVLGLMGKISEGVILLTNMESRLRVHSLSKERSIIQAEEHAPFHDIIVDAKRFVLSNRMIIEKAPLQVYGSALIFSPKQSLIRNQYINQIPVWIKTLPVVEDTWGPLLQTIDYESRDGALVSDVTFSPDGLLLASTSQELTVRLWDAKTGAARGTLEGHSTSVNVVSFSPDSKQLASASADGTVWLWDLMTGAAQGVLKGHSDDVNAIMYSPDGQLLASCSNDGTVRLWNPMTGAARDTLKHPRQVEVLTFSPNGQLLASSSDYTLWLWDPMTGAARGRLKHSKRVDLVTFSPDSQLLASASHHTVRLWNAKTMAALGKLKGHVARVRDISFSPDGQLLASCSNDYTVRLWNAKSGVAQGTLEGHSMSVNSISFSPDSKLLASASNDSTVRLWDATTGTARGTFIGHSDSVMAVKFSPDSQLLASASWDSTVRLWNAKTETTPGTLKGHFDPRVTAMKFSPNGQHLASASDDYTLRLWNPTTGAVMGTLERFPNCWSSMAFSPDSRLLACGSLDGLLLWDTMTGARWGALDANFSHLNAVTFSPDGRLLASGSYMNYNVRLWDPMTGAARGTLEGHFGPVQAVTFSPNGQLLVSASDDHTVLLWDTMTWAARGKLEHSDRVNAIAFSPEGQLLASASHGTLWLWDLRKLELLQTFHSQDKHLSFSTDDFFINTNIGQLEVISKSEETQSQPFAPRWLISEGWLLYNSCRYLWLPPDYRTSCFNAQENRLALALSSHRVITMEFTNPVPT